LSFFLNSKLLTIILVINFLDGHIQENSDNNELSEGAVEGYYHVLLPDGVLNLVTYTADKNGFRASVSEVVSRRKREAGQTSPLMLPIRLPGDVIAKFECDVTSTVGEVKAKIQMALGFPAKHQLLMLGEEELENGKTLKCYEIKENSNIRLIMFRHLY